MMNLTKQPQLMRFLQKPVWHLAITLGLLFGGQPGALAQNATTGGSAVSGAGVNANTGLSQGSIIGNGNMQAEDTGVAVNGENNGNLNNNQNANSNYLIAPSSPGGGQGGSSALVLPRNPLPMPNASLGRSSFGLQVGVNNNPALGALNGGDNAMGWFMQAGLNIPFGKIPDPYRNQNSSKIDELRRSQQAADRRVFGGLSPKKSAPGTDSDKKVKGRVVGLGAYNYSSLPSARLENGTPLKQFVEGLDIPQPRVLALTPADVFSRPLNTGERIGLIEVGKEYPYLGHTRSGWVKVMLPDGSEGWTSTHFEYIKHDFTEIDTLAVDPDAGDRTARDSHQKTVKAAEKKDSKKTGAAHTVKKAAKS